MFIYVLSENICILSCSVGELVLLKDIYSDIEIFSNNFKILF